MPSIQQFAVIAASIISSSVALPAGGPQRPKLFGGAKEIASTVTSFSVEQVYNSDFSGQNGPAAWSGAVAKYTRLQSGEVHHKGILRPASKIASPGDADSTAIDNSDLEYLTPVTVGGKSYLLNFDTGSSNTWIGGSSTLAKNKFNPSGQPVSGSSWSIQYGDGTTAAGDVFMETVVIGETTANQVAVGRATSAPASFFAPGNNGQPGADGLLGLGFTSGSTFNPPQKTWFDVAASQGLPNVFAANLMPGLVPGSYDFGQLNAASYSGPITYLDVVANQPTSNHYWMVQPTVGDLGVMDTGTTLILLSPETTQEFFSSPAAKAAGARYIDNGAYWAFNCKSTLPDFSITIGTHQAVVPGSFLNYQVLQGGLCYAAIQNRDPSMDFSIYGDRFLMTQYVVFDQRTGSPRIGFANKAN